MEETSHPPIDYRKEVSDLIVFSEFQCLCEENDCKICENIITKFCNLARASDVELWPCVKVLIRLTDNLHKVFDNL